MKTVILGEHEHVELDLDRLIVSKMLITAQSGGGKSWLIRRLLEQTHGKVQQIIIDPEGEFYTLREKYDYVLARPKGEGDCPAEPKSAGLLAQSLLQLGVSAILDIYELSPKDRVGFVNNFLVSLVNAPKNLWHKVLIVIDEADIFAPEGAENESTGAVRDAMTRGRKRGFCPILACNRLSQLDKTAAAPAKNVLIGQNTLDVDVKRACTALGMALAEGTRSLRELEDGQFFAFGPALSRQVVKTKIGPVVTTHPQAGAAAPPPAPPRASIQKVLGKLAELPAEAIHREITEKELRQEISDRDRRIRELQKAKPIAAPPVDTAVIVQQVTEQVTAKAHEFQAKRNAGIISMLQRAIDPLQKAIEELSMNGFVAPIMKIANVATARPVPERQPAASPVRLKSATGPADESLKGGKKAVLIAIAQSGETTTEQIALLTGYKGTSRYEFIRSLVARGFVRKVGNSFGATEAGIVALGSDYKPLPTGAELREYWLQKLPGGEAKILQLLLDRYPEAIPKQSLGDLTGYKGTSLYEFVRRLAARKLVTADRAEIVASRDLF